MVRSIETTDAQRQLATLGRSMMDYSEAASMATLKDKDIAQYNMLSEVGHMLTTIGSLFGPSLGDVTTEQKQVMQDFIKYGGSNLPQGGPCLRTTF